MVYPGAEAYGSYVVMKSWSRSISQWVQWGPQTQSAISSSVPNTKLVDIFRNLQSLHIGFKTPKVRAVIAGNVTQEPPGLTLCIKNSKPNSNISYMAFLEELQILLPPPTP